MEKAGFDAFVDGLCAVFYADRLGRPSLRPGRYFRLLFIGYFEGLSSERGIAWRVSDSLSLRAFLDLDVTEATPNHSTLSRTRRLIDVETHGAVFTWVLERLAEAGLVKGKTVGVDATALEANATMRSIERRDTEESYEAFVRRLAKASGIESPTRAELARFDRSRKNRKTSNKEWKSPQDPDAKIAKMKDGRTHLAHKAEHAVDLETGAILSSTVQDASEGDSATLPETLTMAAEQVEAVQPDGEGVEEVVADKGYHSDKTLVALEELGVRSYVSEPERGRRCWQDKKTGETPAEKHAAQQALYGNCRRIGGDRGRRLQRRRGELVERPFAHQYETGGLRRVWVRGHENVRKRVLIQAAGCILRAAAAAPDRGRHAPEPAGASSFGHFGPDRASDRALGASDARLGGQMDTGGARSLNRSSPSYVTGPAQRTDFFHRLLGRNSRAAARVAGRRVASAGPVTGRYRRMRILLSTVVFALVLASLPHEAGAQDRRAHWGVSAGFAPRWTASSTWVEKLYGADTMDWAGSDLRVGVVRGSDLGGDWGIAFVRRLVEDGGIHDVTEAAGGGSRAGDGRRYVTNGVTAQGVEVHRFAPFGGAIADRVQIGLEFGAGVAMLDGLADRVDPETGGVIESVPAGTALALRGVDKLGVDGLLPLGRLELAVAAIPVRGLKVKVKGGLNFPGTEVFSVSVQYLFGAN